MHHLNKKEPKKSLPAFKVGFTCEPSVLIFANQLPYFTAKREHASQHKEVSVLQAQSETKLLACGTVADGGSRCSAVL